MGATVCVSPSLAVSRLGCPWVSRSLKVTANVSSAKQPRKLSSPKEQTLEQAHAHAKHLNACTAPDMHTRMLKFGRAHAQDDKPLQETPHSLAQLTDVHVPTPLLKEIQVLWQSALHTFPPGSAPNMANNKSHNSSANPSVSNSKSPVMLAAC